MTGKTVKDWIVIAIPLVIVGMLFALQDTLIGVGSEGMSRMQDKRAAAGMADSVRLLYDYSNGHGEGFRYTVLEFGAKGCISCWKMEGVMEEVRTNFAGRVKVRFVNVSEKGNQEWTKYFGVAMIPTQVVLDSTGREVFRHTGFISAGDLVKVFK